MISSPLLWGFDPQIISPFCCLQILPLHGLQVPLSTNHPLSTLSRPKPPSFLSLFCLKTAIDLLHVFLRALIHSPGLVAKGTKHIQLVKSVPGLLSRLLLELIVACGIADVPWPAILPSLALQTAALPLVPALFSVVTWPLSLVPHPGP